MPPFAGPSMNRVENGHLQLRHGPIELVIEAFGSHVEVEESYKQAITSFSTVLAELVSELEALRKPSGAHAFSFRGKIAAQMAEVAGEYSSTYFVTPMIAVAGAVSDHILRAMTVGRALTRAYVNNGGDIAIYLAKEQSFNIGVCSNPYARKIASKTNIAETSGIRGIATSGWRGRSHSLGIADSVTVLACTAAKADAAATVIANAINLPNHPMIKRKVATELNPDSDLGSQMVTVDVGSITTEETLCALKSGQKLAQSMIDSGQVIGVYGCLNSRMFSLRSLSTRQDPSMPFVHNLEKELVCA